MNRRDFLTLAAGAASVLLLPAMHGAWAQSGQRFSRIVVDMAPLEARGGRGAAAIIRPQLQASLQREFAGRIGGRGPTLVVRVHTVLLGPQLPDGGGARGSGPGTDYLEAEFIVGEQHKPLLVTQSTGSFTWYLPDNEVQRLRGLADSLAAWVRRYA